MCGRFTLRTPLTVLIEHFDLDSRGDRQLPLFHARYNIAPTQDVLVVRSDSQGAGRDLKMLRWGLIPSWSKFETAGLGAPLINARSETLAEKPAFRTAYRRRCLIPADGFYEWQQSPSASQAKKQPFYIHRPDGQPFAFAGLWESWAHRPTELPPHASLSKKSIAADDGSLTIESCTIVTTPANATLREIELRMPVVLAPNDYAIWLDPKTEDPATLQYLLTACGDEELIAEPVSTHVNKAANDDARCISVQKSLF